MRAPLKIQILVPANLKVTLHSNFVVSKLLRCRKNFLLTYGGAAKFFSSGQPKGYPTLKLRFPRLAFGRTLNFLRYP